jgi:tetratricopeptide (TPR) repeat protein
VSAAVTAGRQRMFARNGRPSRKGDMRLDDWVIPVHYLRRDVSFPQAVTSRPGPLSLDEELDQIRHAAGQAGSGELDPVGSFTGRDALFYLLEIAARLQRVVVLHGPGGTGKTELAKAFGRWWRDTGGVENPGFVFWHSFEPGVATFGLDGVINQIGLSLFGADFARLERGERHAVVEKALTEHRMLLIWDNFETVRSMPDPEGVTRPLDEDGCRELQGFAGRLAGRGRSAVLITSRSPEAWLGEVRRITVGGLTPSEADQYATYLLEPYPAAARWRARPAFGELMEWLDGHPLSMRLILPHLETTEPGILLEALRGTTPLPGGWDGDGGGRMTSLPASIAYSYAHLAESTRRLLPAVSLFQAVADEDVLAMFSGHADVPERFCGATKDDWRNALEDAAAVGLLTPLWGGMYRIHPALPAYLAAHWREEEAGTYDATRETAVRVMVGACAGLCDWLHNQIFSGDAGLAYAVIGLQLRTLGSMLGYALAHGLCADAGHIIDPLNEYWNARGLDEEADAWADQVRLITEDSHGIPRALDNPSAYLWLLTTRAQGQRQVSRFQLHEAETTYHNILAHLDSIPPSRTQKQYIIDAYFQLGVISQSRGLADDAEVWYRKTLSLEEQIEDRANMAETYHQLGRVAQDRGQLDDAENWYRKALTIREERGNQRGMAASYNQLGIIAQKKGKLNDAENWHRKALMINEALGDKRSISIAYHHLGMIAQGRGQFEQAENWHRGELAISEEIGDKVGLGFSYHQLGVIAQLQGRRDDAEDWLRRALAIEQELGDTPGMALTLGQLGSLAERQGHDDQALELVIRCVSLFDEFPHELTEPGPAHLAQLTGRLGMAALEETWRQVTGNPLPPAVRDYVQANQPTTEG